MSRSGFFFGGREDGNFAAGALFTEQRAVLVINHAQTIQREIGVHLRQSAAMLCHHAAHAAGGNHTHIAVRAPFFMSSMMPVSAPT